MSFQRAAALLLMYAEASEREEAAQNASEERIAEAIAMLHNLPDQEAIRAHLNRRDAVALRFLAATLMEHSALEEGVVLGSDDPTEPGVTHVSFLKGGTT